MDVVGIALVAPAPVADGPAPDRDPLFPNVEFERLLTEGVVLPPVVPIAANTDPPVPTQTDGQSEDGGEDILPDLQFAALISGQIIPAEKTRGLVPPAPDGRQNPGTKATEHAGLSLAVARDPTAMTDVTLRQTGLTADGNRGISAADSGLSPAPALSATPAAPTAALSLAAAAATITLPDRDVPHQSLGTAGDLSARLIAGPSTPQDANARDPQDYPNERSATPPSRYDPRHVMMAPADDTRVPDTPFAIVTPSDDAQPRLDPVTATKEMHTARHVAQQIAAEVTPTGSGKTEILLDPAELGRVRLSLQATDQTISIHINADRTETADLMRRHIDQLIDEFRTIGYQDVRFSFAEQSDRQTPQWQGGTSSGEPGSGRRSDSGAAFGPDERHWRDIEGPAPARPVAGQLDMRL